MSPQRELCGGAGGAGVLPSSLADVISRRFLTLPLPLLPLSHSDSEHQARSINDSGLQFKFLVPAAVVGAVLGRGGSTVAAIKRETGAYVQFTRPGTATNTPRDRMMIVAVESREQLPRAVALMFEAIEAEGAIDRMRTKQYASDKLFFQQVRARLPGPGCSSCGVIRLIVKFASPAIW